MNGRGVTIEEAARTWVEMFNGVQTSMLYRLTLDMVEGVDWCEVTKPHVGSSVLIMNTGEYGDVVSVYPPKDECDGYVYEVETEDWNIVLADEENVKVVFDTQLPCWFKMWQFDDMCDTYWLTDKDGVRIMSDHGFRVFDFGEYGYYFGLDAVGVSFWDKYWTPLYIARGLQWHDPQTDGGRFVLTDARRAALFDKVVQAIEDEHEEYQTTRDILAKIGMTEDELDYVGYEVLKKKGA